MLEASQVKELVSGMLTGQFAIIGMYLVFYGVVLTRVGESRNQPLRAKMGFFLEQGIWALLALFTVAGFLLALLVVPILQDDWWSGCVVFGLSAILVILAANDARKLFVH